MGNTIELIIFDNKSTALGSKLAAKKAVQAGVICVIGAFWSSHSLDWNKQVRTSGKKQKWSTSSA